MDSEWMTRALRREVDVSMMAVFEQQAIQGTPLPIIASERGIKPAP